MCERHFSRLWSFLNTFSNPSTEALVLCSVYGALRAFSRCASLLSYRSEVDRLFGLLQFAVAAQIHGDSLLGRVLLCKTIHAGGAGAVNFLLVELLQLVGRVAEDFAVFLDDFRVLGHGQAMVQHVLVVLHQRLVAAHLVIETSLGVREQVTLLREGSHVAASAAWGRHWVVLA